MEYDVVGYGLQRCAARFRVPVFWIGLFVVDVCILYSFVTRKDRYIKDFIFLSKKRYILMFKGVVIFKVFT